MIPNPVVTCPAPPSDPVVGRYRTLFAQLDWTPVAERDPDRPWPGRTPHPQSAYIKALLVKLEEHLAYVTQLRRFLVEHPALVLELGFRPVPDPTQPLGVDVERTVPGARWLRQQQRILDQPLLGALLNGTVQTLQQQVPDLGQTIAIDVKHSYAWVAENNPKETIAQRYDPQRRPRGDPDCRLGVKYQGNQTDQQRHKTYLWGYGSGILSTTHPLTGDVVLADVTQPFNRQDISYYRPLMDRLHRQAVLRPRNLAADAAFDAWYVYQDWAEAGGIAAIPRNRRGHQPSYDADGHPCCVRGFAMTPTTIFKHEDGYHAQRYCCPLLYPTPTGETCDQPQFQTGRGCHKALNIEPGGQLRRELDRTSPAFQQVYRQRTSAERINSQATTLGIERPKVRRFAAVVRLNTLTYLLINLRVLLRLHLSQHPQPPPLC